MLPFAPLASLVVPSLLVALSTSPAAAQAAADTSGSAHWTGWSPLRRIGDPGRGGPQGARLPDMLLLPAPRAGAFWSAGNSGALAFELDTAAHARFDAFHAARSGDFRRPLDPGRLSQDGVFAAAQQQLGASGAAIGRAVVERRGLSDGGTNALGVEPYAASPLVPTDTIAPDGNRSIVLLDGTLGWRLGGWGVGLSAAFEAIDARAERTRIGRVGRVSAPAGTVGITRALPFGLSAGVYARAQRRTERLTTVVLTAPEQVFELQGYAEVEPGEYGTRGYSRRFVRRAGALGATLGGAVGPARLVAWLEDGRLREEQSSVSAADPPTDRWAVDAATIGLSAHTPLPSALGSLTASARRTAHEGAAERFDLEGKIYRDEHVHWVVDGEARMRVPRTAWNAAASGFLLRRERHDRDFLAELYTRFDSWTSGGALEVGGPVAPRLTIAASGGLALYTPSSVLAAPDSLGPVYQRLIAPELDYYATPALATSGAITVRWLAHGRTAYWLRIGGERIAPRDAVVEAEFRPSGTRTLLRVSAGALLGPPGGDAF